MSIVLNIGELFADVEKNTHVEKNSGKIQDFFPRNILTVFTSVLNISSRIEY